MKFKVGDVLKLTELHKKELKTGFNYARVESIGVDRFIEAYFMEDDKVKDNVILLEVFEGETVRFSHLNANASLA